MTNATSSTENNQPEHRIRLSTISAAIFANQNQEGRVFYNVQFDRSYKDGDQWKHTRSFSREDLLNLAKVADLAHTWIYQQNASANQNIDSTTEAPDLTGPA